MKKYTYIEPDEKIIGVTKKIRAIKDREIWLVLPARSGMSTLAGLRQLREQVTKLDKKITIISNDSQVLANARAAGFLTQPSGQSTPTSGTTKKNISKPSVLPQKKIKIVYKQKKDNIVPTELDKPLKTKPVSATPPPSLANQLLLGTLSVISLIIIIAVVLLIVPTAEINITSQAQTIELETTLTVDTEQKDIDYINNVIPAQLINSEQEYIQEERATGTTNTGSKSSGVITVYNKTSSDISLVGNTRFLSSDNKLFRSTQSANVPANGSANVSVISDTGGAENNIGPSRFTMPALPGSESYLYGQSSANMTGGTDEILYSISQDDINYSSDEIRQKIYDQAVNDLKTKLPANRDFISLPLDQISFDITTDHQTGDQVETFNIIARGVVPFIVYDSSNLQDIVTKNLAKLISKERTIGDQGMENLSVEVLQLDVPSGYALLKIGTQAVSLPSYDTEQIKRDLTGKSAEEVKEYFLNYPEIQQIDITFWPEWVNRVSKIPARVELNINW